MNTKQSKAIELIYTLTQAIMEAVRAAGSQGVPSGHIYARVNSVGVDIDTYNFVLDNMLKGGWVRRNGHLLTPGEKMR